MIIAGASRDVVWSETRDSGGMFNDTVGVYKDEGYVAFVRDGWGGGIKSRPYATLAEAKANIERLWEKYYG